MTLADKLEAAILEAAIARQGDRRCNFALALDGNPDDADAIWAKSAPGRGREMRRQVVCKVLEEAGFPGCGESTIDRHWRKVCACYK